MYKLKVILTSTVAAVAYGLVHDQITIRICPEYFTIAHPHLFHVNSLTALALCWGVAATIGVGFILGALLALVADSGGAPPVPLKLIRARLAKLLLLMGTGAAVCSALAYVLWSQARLSFPSGFEGFVSAEQEPRFMAAWFAHAGSYAVGIGGGLRLIWRLWTERGRPRVLALAPRTALGYLRVTLLILTLVAVRWWLFRS